MSRFADELAEAIKVFKVGDTVRLKSRVADGDRTEAKIERFYSDIEGGCRLDTEVNGFVSWNLTDLVRVRPAMLLSDWFPIRDPGTGISESDACFPHLDVEVIEEVRCQPDEGPQRPWPGKQLNVHCYVRLANGKIVGLNENPSRGWSFPVMKDPQA